MKQCRTQYSTRLRAIWTAPEEHNFPLQHFLTLWWGWREVFTLKTAYLEMALLYFWPTGNLTLFIWECFFDLILLRNGEFYSVDNIYGCLSSHAIAWL
jgi:hypothetical protein